MPEVNVVRAGRWGTYRLSFLVDSVHQLSYIEDK